MLEKLLIVQQWVIWFWNMLSDNSGQIQILIAVVALVYARRAYLRVVDQVGISIYQDKEAYKQRNYELKIEVLNHYLKMSNTVNLKLKSLNEFVHGINNTLEGENTEIEKQQLQELLSIVNKKITESEELKDLIFINSKAIIDMKDFDYREISSKLNDIYTALLYLSDESDKLELLKTMYLVEED